MYQTLGGSDVERAENFMVIKKWIGGWTLKRSADITDTERKAIKAWKMREKRFKWGLSEDVE